MRDNITPNTLEPAGGDPATGSTHQERAAAVIAALDALVVHLPPAQKVPTAVLRVHRSVPTDFMESVVATTDQYEEVREVAALDTKATNDRLEILSVYRPVLVRAIKFVEQLTTMIDGTRAKAAYDTLDAYAAVRRLANRPGSNQRVFKSLEKELGRKRKAKPEDPAQKAAKTTAPSPGITPPLPPPAAQKAEVSTTK